MNDLYLTISGLIERLTETLPENPSEADKALLKAARFQQQVIRMAENSARRATPLIDELDAMFERQGAELSILLNGDSSGSALLTAGLETLVSHAGDMARVFSSNTTPKP